MYNKIEEIYKKKSAYNRITRKFFVVYVVSFLSIWIFGVLRHTYISVALVLILIYSMKEISERELKKKFYISMKFDKANDNTLQAEINKQEISIIKNYLMLNEIYNEKNITNIISHYRNLIVPKGKNDNFWNIVTLIITLIVPFVNKDGINIDMISLILPYFISLIIVCGIIYCSYKQIFTLTKSLTGELRMYERLEEIFSELLVEINCDRMCYNKEGDISMDEKELDSSANEYEEQYKSSNYVKQLQWDMAIGLQEVDNLKPSKYLEKLLEEEVEGNLTIKEVEKELKEYYIEKENKNEINHNELECDFVSTRIVELLNKDNFNLSVDYLKYVHKFLFQDVYEFAGEFRKIDFSKHEKYLIMIQ